MSEIEKPEDRVLRLRWMALMLNLPRDISAYASEFQAILEVPPKSKPT
jgi:hypothetical protein